MTIATWKAEFYARPASDFSRENETVSDYEALLHSQRKWEGLREENLAKHDLERRGRKLVPKGFTGNIFGLHRADVFDVDDTSCSLCVRFMYAASRRCRSCPLVAANGGISCDRVRYPDGTIGLADSAYSAFVENGDPLPMISLIAKAIEAAGEPRAEAERLEKQEAFEKDVAANIRNYGYYQVTLNGGRRSWTKVDLGILADLLPHGSGLNDSWYVTVAKNGKVTCRSTFSPMNEHGYYLADVEVGAEFTMGAELVLGRVWARRDETLRDYMFQLMDEAREKYNTAAKADETKVPVGWDKV